MAEGAYLRMKWQIHQENNPILHVPNNGLQIHEVKFKKKGITKTHLS